MLSNSQIVGKLRANKKRANALQRQAFNRVSTNNMLDKQIITENIKNRKAMGGKLNKIGYKRNAVFRGNTTQKQFPAVYNAKNPLNAYKSIDVSGGAVGDYIANSQHQGIISAGQKYTNAWRNRNRYIRF
jgi:hypothetical protein